MPRLFRQSPLNSIWEGSGNVIALDVLRGLTREPEAVDAIVDDLASVRGADPALDREAAALATELRVPTDEAGARRLVERTAIALQAAALARQAPSYLAEAFCAARLGEGRSLSYGAGTHAADAKRLIDRAMPV